MRWLLMLTLLLLLQACFQRKKAPVETPVAKVEIPDMQLGTLLSETTSDKSGRSGFIRIDYSYYATERYPWQQMVNQDILNWLKVYYQYQPAAYITKPNESCMQQLLDQLGREEQAMQDVQPIVIPWRHLTAISIHDDRPDLVEICYADMGYRGGNEEKSNFEIHHLRKSDQQWIGIKELIRDSVWLHKTALEAFRQQMELRPGETLWEAGYLFENNQFYLPENFMRDETGITFYYNPGQIASPRRGNILLFLSEELIRSKLNPGY